MTDLVAFLRARLDEDEAHARKDIYMAEAATPGPWRAHIGINLPHSYLRAEDGSPIATFESVRHNDNTSLSARFHPATVMRRAAHVLADVEAKRQIISQFQIMWGGANWSEGVKETLQLNLHALASVYADHPDYDESWRP